MYLEFRNTKHSFFQEKEVIIFGAGGRGQKIFFEMLQLGSHVLAFCDNNPDLAGTFIEDRPVITPEQLIGFPGAEIVIASTYYEEIEKQLMNLQIKNIHTLIYGVAEKKIQESQFRNPYLKPQEANDHIYHMLKTDDPFFLGRLGSVELECLCQNQKLYENEGIREVYDRNIRYMMENNAGFFPGKEEYLNRFCQLYFENLQNTDLLWSMWGSYFEDLIYEKFAKNTPICSFDDSCLPLKLENPWTKALKGKRVLVIHPFTESIEKNYKNRERLYEQEDFLPEFHLQTMKSVQSIAGEKTIYEDWFLALEAMKAQMRTYDFDIALTGAGAYGFPLAEYAKELGKKGIHIGGPLQLLFGIKGKAYHSMGIYNEYWTEPLDSERPENYKRVEAGRYW